MIERVAIALYGADGFALAMWPPAEAWLKDRESVRERYRGLARAAIGAMREPTEAMVRAGNGDCMSYFGDEPFPSFERGWASAIDAALT